MNITAIILAGGTSSRMGTDKGLVLFKGKMMIEHIIATLEKLKLAEIIIISNNSKYKTFGKTVYPDMVKGKGPLAGIYTGLSKSKTVKNLILTCDVPFIDKSILELLFEESEDKLITVVKSQNQVHHLIGIYDASLVGRLGEHLIENKLKVEQFNQEMNANIIDLDAKIPEMKEIYLANINSKEELNKMHYEM